MSTLKSTAAFAIAAIAASITSGCANPKAASEENFSTAIRVYMAAHDERQCTQDSLSFPQSYYDRAAWGPSMTSDATTTYDALASAGLVTRSVHSTYHQAAMFMPAWTERVTTYNISPDGQRYVSKQQGYGSSVFAKFCYAYKALDRVTNFTVPGDLGGMTISQVRYTYSLSNVAQWANNKRIDGAFPDVEQTMQGADATQESTTLTLTNNGWEVAGS